MPDFSENYESEISNGRNFNEIKCKFCKSLILSPTSAAFTTFKQELPLIRQSKLNSNNTPETETLSLFWMVDGMFDFQNVGFSHTVGSRKYLVCSDCEAGPIGYHDINSKKNYVALSRVQHG